MAIKQAVLVASRLLVALTAALLISACGSGGSESAATTPATGAANTATGKANLSWLPPTSNSDGSALTDLKGYRILYGHSPADLDQSVSVSPATNGYVVENLTAGTWYFGIVAINSSDVESALSGVVSKTIG